MRKLVKEKYIKILEVGILVVGIGAIGIGFYSHWHLSLTFDQVTALGQLSHDIQQKLSVAHLWLEEALAGDESIDLGRDVYHNIEEAIELVTAALAGGDTHLGKVQPVKDERTHTDLLALEERLQRWRIMTARRWQTRETTGRTGALQDQEYDAAFQEILDLGQKVVTDLAVVVALYRKSLTRINTAIILFLFTLFAAIIIVMSRHRRAISATNIELERGIRERTAQLMESDARTRTILDNTLDGIITIDSRGIVERFNKACERMFCYNADEVIGKSVTTLIREPCKNEHDGYVGRYFRTGSAKLVGRSVEVVGQRKDGLTFPMELAVSEIQLNNRRLFVGLVRDITERKRVEAELTNAKETAEAANAAKGDFLANMSHEIRTPLNAIIGMTELTLETNLTTEQRGFLDVVQASSEGLLSLINDILDFSKIEAGQMELENIEFNLHEVVESVVEILSVRAQSKGLELLCYVEPTIPSRVGGDQTRLRQILVNLVGNAIKFTETGEVVVECRLWNGEPGRPHLPEPAVRIPQSAIRHPNSVPLHFSVRDTGIGISEENIEKIFQKFSQADTSTTRKFGGTGLGLNISKSLVELMGGEMWIESREGQGSTFHFKLTLSIGQTQSEAFDYAYPDFNAIATLVVDDNETNRFILRKTLTAWGFPVREAHSGPQALAILRESAAPIQLILLDQQMPDMDGLELAQKVREEPNWAEIRMIMLSSVGNIDSALNEKLDIARCIPKPVKQSKLLDILMEVLRVENRAVQTIKVVTPEEANTKTVPNRILLVEDNLDNQGVAKRILQRAGYVVDLAENGQLAVEAAEQFHYDLIFMDIQMPVLDGFAATEEIRALERRQQEEKVPVIALTAHALKGYRERCSEHGMDDYVTKPIRKKILLQTVHKWLDPRPTVLIVDDSMDNRHLLKNYLKKQGDYKLVFAHNGQEALDVYRRRTISLVLMDMEMPVMDGYTATSAIRQFDHGQEVPIIALTAHQGKAVIDQCLDAGCTAFLSKPVRKQILLETMRQHLEKSTALTKTMTSVEAPNG